MASVEVIQADAGTPPTEDPIAIQPSQYYESEEGWERGDYITIERGFNTAVYRIYDFFALYDSVGDLIDPANQEQEVKMGLDGRARLYDPGATVPDSFFGQGERFFTTPFLGIGVADSSWPELNDAYAVRANSNFLNEYGFTVGDRVEINSEETFSVNTYEISDTFSDGVTEPLLRMGQNARERLNIGDSVSSQAGVKPVEGAWDFIIRKAYPSSTVINDTHGIHISDKAQTLMTREFGENVAGGDWIEVTHDFDTELYGIYSVEPFEYVRPVIRMGAVARDRLGITDAEMPLTINIGDLEPYSKYDPNAREIDGTPVAEPKPFIKQAFSSWDAEIGNPLLCRPSTNLASRLGVSSGDMIKITAEFSGTERSEVYRVSQTHDSDQMLEVPRMGFWGRTRLFNTADEDTQGRFFVESVEVFDEPENIRYVGVAQALSEWDWGSNKTYIAVSPALKDELDLKVKFTGPEAEGGTQNAEWSNVRLEHTRYDDRKAAYTTYFTHTEDPEWPTVRTSYLGRERLNDTTRHTETGDVPNLFAAKLKQPVTDQTVRTESDAKARGETYELSAYTPDDRVLMSAPHGGPMELNTGKQAVRSAQLLNCSYWAMFGETTLDSGSFERWHITSTDVSVTDGYPMLAEAPTNFTYAVSYQGYSKDYILVGGRIPFEKREALAAELSKWVTAEVRPALPDEEQPPEQDLFDADDPDHYASQLTDDGPLAGDGSIQLEQPFAIRRDEWEAVTRGVAKWIRQDLDYL